ncbi:MAG: hypothetical protein K0S66_1474 [Sphingomonas sp.]|nr:hypothetical protein [Sphingomonas sp.]
MPVVVKWYRALCFGKPCGPWRFGAQAACRDLIAQDLGSYDEEGTFFITVPGGLESRSEWMTLEEEEELAQSVKRRHSAEHRERLPVPHHNRLVRRVGRTRF